MEVPSPQKKYKGGVQKGNECKEADGGVEEMEATCANLNIEQQGKMFFFIEHVPKMSSKVKTSKLFLRPTLKQKRTLHKLACISLT